MERPRDTRVIVYPDYINAKKTVAEGRRIPLDKAVEWPTLPQMYDACIKGLKLETEPERKLYPRNWCLVPGYEQCFGRLRVALKNPDGSPANPEVPTRRELLIKIAELVSRHPDRHKQPGASSGASSSSTGSSSKQQSGKKGKKKK